MNTEGSFYCTCDTLFKLNSDNHTCRVLGSHPLLFYTTAKKIKSFDLNSRTVLEIRKTKQAIGVSYDGQSVYWTDISMGKEAILKFTPIMNKTETLVMAGLETPEDLAIDWLTGNIYFTDSNRKMIGVCSSSGYYCTQLVTKDVIDKPRAIDLHPSESLLYWTDWGENPHIGVSFMDGSEARVLLDGMQ